MTGYELITKHGTRLSVRRDRGAHRTTATGGRGHDRPDYTDGETGGVLAGDLLRESCRTPRSPGRRLPRWWSA